MHLNPSAEVSTLILRSHTSASEIPDAVWASLSGGRTLYASKRWYQATESHSEMAPRYLCVHGLSDRLLGLVRVFLAAEPYSQFYDPACVFGETLCDAGTRWRPHLLVGSRMSTNELLVAPDLAAEESRSVVEVVAGALRDLADGIPLASMYMPEEDARVLQVALGPDAVRLNSGASGELHVRWPDMDGYLASLPPSRRQAVRRECRKFQQAGYSVTTNTLATVQPEITPLIVNVDRKHEVEVSEDQRTEELVQQARLLSDQSIVFLCRAHDGSLVACSVLFRHGSALHARHVGFDYDRANSFEYFNLLFYLPLEYAISSQVSSIHYGLSTDAKAVRGVRQVRMQSVLWQRGWHALGVDRRAAAWNATDGVISLLR